ncbi:hypothetical protein ACIUX3_19875, partial [Pseudomonas aeruginosa]
HQGRGLSFELGGKRTSLLAHQTPLSRRGFSPKSVSGISRPLHTGPLSGRDLQALGLKDLARKLSAQAGREVNFMIYDSAATAASRAPSLVLPK